MPVHPNRGAIGRAAVIAGVVALLLGACVPTQPIAVVTSSATPAPVFATDAEALAAAEEAYAAYQAALDYAFTTYDLTEVMRTASDVALAEAESAVARLQNDGIVQEGSTLVVSVSIAEIAADGSSIVADICIDVSKTDLVDATGNSIVADGRDVAIASDVNLDWSIELVRFVVSSDVPRETGDRCVSS